MGAQTHDIELVEAVRDIVAIIDAKINAIREEDKQYTGALMRHMRGEVLLGPDRFKWNRAQLVRCTTAKKTLMELRNEILGEEF